MLSSDGHSAAADRIFSRWDLSCRFFRRRLCQKKRRQQLERVLCLCVRWGTQNEKANTKCKQQSHVNQASLADGHCIAVHTSEI